MFAIKAEAVTFDNNDPFIAFKTSNMCLDDMPEDQPLFWFDEIGFVIISKSSLIQALYFFQRNLHLNADCTLSRLYEFLGLSTKLKRILNAETSDYLNSYGWTDYYIYDMGYNWLDFYFNKRFTSTGVQYYELGYSIEPIDLTIPYDG